MCAYDVFFFKECKSVSVHRSSPDKSVLTGLRP